MTAPCFATHTPDELAKAKCLVAGQYPDMAGHAGTLAGLGLSFSVIFQLLMLVITNGPKVIGIVQTLVAAIKAGGLTPETIALILTQWPGIEALLKQILAILGVQHP